MHDSNPPNNGQTQLSVITEGSLRSYVPIRERRAAELVRAAASGSALAPAGASVLALKSALGIKTKSSPTSGGQNEATGPAAPEFVPFQKTPNLKVVSKACSDGTETGPLDDLAVEEKRRTIRSQRYELQHGARAIALFKGEQAGLEHPANWNRVAKCCHTKVAEHVDIQKSRKYGKAFFSGVAVCGSVWVCPVCAAKIQERRREEIKQALDWAYSNRMQAVMITLTFPHYSFQSCKELLDKQAAALADLRKGNSWDCFKNRMGFRGLIRSLEVTRGRNGWHPHTHELWFVDATLKKSDIKEFLLDRWMKICKKHGLLSHGKTRAFREHSVDIKMKASSSDYLAKQDDARHWGVDREIAKASTKTSKGDHPFGLLSKFIKHDSSSRAAGLLFAEYMEAFKGKRQLFWSHGLKDLVGVNDKTDEELAAESQEEADILATLEHFGWQAIRRERAQALILDLAEREGHAGILRWLKARGVSDTAKYDWTA